MKKLLIISLLFAIASMPLAFYGRSQIIEQAESMLVNGTRTHALIVEKRHWNYGRYGGQALLYQFTDRWSGGEYIIAVDVDKETYSSVDEGSGINVIYDPADPTNSDRLDLYKYQAKLPIVDYATVCLIPISMFVMGILVTATVKGLAAKIQNRTRSARGR